MTKKLDVRASCVAAHKLFDVTIAETGRPPQRWTRQAVWARIRELEKLPPIRTEPTPYVYEYWRQGQRQFFLPSDRLKAIIRLEYVKTPTMRKVRGLVQKFGLSQTTILEIINGG